MKKKTAFSPNQHLRRAGGPVGQHNSFGSRAFDIFNYVFVTLVAFTTILPFIYIIGASLPRSMSFPRARCSSFRGT